MKHLFGFYSIIVACCACAAVAHAAPKLTGDAPVLMEARELGYDTEQNLVVAIGNVEVVQGEYIVTADRITYSQTSNVVTAEGNVAVLEPSGHVYFAEAVELKDDLKQGVVNNFRARLADNSLFAAREAKRINEQVTELKKAVYSPCKICTGGESHDPLWQIKADKVTYDEGEQRISYNNAFFEIYGVPVLYTPYLSHSTPGADRKSGFMIPEYAHSSSLGTLIKQPYYINIAADKEAIITPIYTGEEGMALQGSYRQLTDSGEYEFEGSITNPRQRDAQGNTIEGRDMRGHVRARGSSAINDYVNWGFNINRTTDDTYMRRYDYGDEDTLTSRVYVEGINDRSYGIVQGLAFQGLTLDDDPDRSPLIFPLMQGQYETGPLWEGSRLRMAASALVLQRDLGSSTRRLTLSPSWWIPYVSDGGHVFELETQLRTDFYSVNDVLLDAGGEFDGSVSRMIPQIALSWRYPLVKSFARSSLVLEPIVQFIASPYGANDDKIPNEDNEAPEFSDVNLFSYTHYAGLDLVESGPRVNYGVRGQWQQQTGENYYFLLGQHYQLDSQNRFPFSTALDEELSDYVGRVGVEYLPFDVSYRFRLDRDTLTPHRNEVNAMYIKYPVTWGVSYVSLDDDPFQDDKEEVFSSLAFALNENWTFTLGGRRDLLEGGGMVDVAGGLIFQNECVTLITGLDRQFTRDRDIEPSTSFSVRLSLKNLN